MTRKPFNRCGLIPRSLLRRDSGVGWVESFGFAQDRLRDTHRSPRWVSALCASTHPTISLEVRVLRYPAACGGVVHWSLPFRHLQSKPIGNKSAEFRYSV